MAANCSLASHQRVRNRVPAFVDVRPAKRGLVQLRTPTQPLDFLQFFHQAPDLTCQPILVLG